MSPPVSSSLHMSSARWNCGTVMYPHRRLSKSLQNSATRSLHARTHAARVQASQDTQYIHIFPVHPNTLGPAHKTSMGETHAPPLTHRRSCTATLIFSCTAAAIFGKKLPP